MSKFIIRLVILAVIVGAAWGGYRFVQSMPERQQAIATAKVRQGEIVVRTCARG